jgi:hypothetical protein
MSKSITVRISFEGENKNKNIYDIFEKELKYGLKSCFLKNILSVINTDDEKLLRKRIFSILTKDFSISFPGLDLKTSQADSEEKGNIVDNFKDMKGKFLKE